MPNSDDAIDMQIAYDIEHENDEYELQAHLNDDKWGHPGLPREDARFLAHCRGELSKEEYESLR